MYSSEVKFIEPIVGRSYMAVSEHNIMGWKRLSKLNYNKFPNVGTTRFLLLHELGSGNEGRAWLACTQETGSVCCLKIFHKKKDEDNADLQERLTNQEKYWKDIWKIDNTLILSLQGTKAFAMPYVLIATKLDLGAGRPPNLNDDPALKKAVLDALRRLTANGYQHIDLKLGHVGFYKNAKGEIKALLVDLTLKEIGRDNSDRQKAYEEMRNKLGLTE